MDPEQIERASRRLWAAHVAEHLTADELDTIYRIVGVQSVGVSLMDRPRTGSRCRLGIR